MRFMFTIPLIFMALAAPAAASATGDANAASSDAAEALVGQIVHPVNGQIARFADGICPTILGVNEEFGRRVAKRIRDVAETAGAPVAPEVCAGNVMVVFTNDPATFFRSVEQDHSGWLQSLSRRAREQLGNSSDPIIAWHSVSIRDGDNQPVGLNVSASQPIATIRVRDASFVRPVTRQTVDNAFVLVSLSAIDGRPLYQIADNIALRALTPLDAPRSSAIPTVLTAFAEQAAQAPSAMTTADAALLKAIYAGNGEATASVERHKVAEAVAKGHAG